MAHSRERKGSHCSQCITRILRVVEKGGLYFSPGHSVMAGKVRIPTERLRTSATTSGPTGLLLRP